MKVKIPWPKKVDGNYSAQIIPPFYAEIIKRGDSEENPTILELDVVDLARHQQGVNDFCNLIERTVFGSEPECDTSSES